MKQRTFSLVAGVIFGPTGLKKTKLQNELPYPIKLE